MVCYEGLVTRYTNYHSIRKYEIYPKGILQSRFVWDLVLFLIYDI